MRVAPKNRKSSKRKAQRQGVSGNPQRRAEQLQRTAAQQRQEQGSPSGAQAGFLRELAYLFAGGSDEAPWWRDSHERVIRGARAVNWSPRLSGIEDQTCELVGGQFYDNLQAHNEGHHQAQWLRALVEYAGVALRKAIADGGDWLPLWTLLYGLALTTSEPAPAAEQDTALRAEFPNIKDPHATAVAELSKAKTLLSPSERLVASSLPLPVSGARPAGIPLVARDAYGSRVLVAAPFGYDAGVPDHWYAWDIDGCWALDVVGAGTFGSSEEALADWRGAVGSAAAGRELSPGDPGLVVKLLGPCLETGPLADVIHGNEPRELIRELYRMRRRAQALASDVPADSAEDVDQLALSAEVSEAFRAWYRARHPDVPKGIAAAVETILSEWGPVHPLDERSFYSCPPFRVAMTAHLIGNSYQGDYANRAIRLLPEWTQWCAQQSALPDRLAAPSIAAARSAADTLDKQDADELPDPGNTLPFRHQE